MLTAWQVIVSILGAAAIIGGFLYWHIRETRRLEADIRSLELKFKDLETRDSIQQQTIDNLSNIYEKMLGKILNGND